MRRPSVDEMFSGKQSRYSLVIAIAKRARQITDEQIAKGEISTEKSVKLATQDFKDHKYSILEPEVND